MLRFAKKICALAVLGLGVQNALPFAMLGPFEPYQVAVLTYQVGGDLGGPKNLGEEFRRNTPEMYYTMDANFLDYFGTDGSNAIVQAFEIMNALTNMSALSQDLSEFPMEAQSYNFQAQALELLDLKSVTLLLIVEQLGLAEPDRYTWTLHDRLVGPPPGCPTNVTYTVMKRNFDPVFTTTDQLQPTSYVNGTLYSYFIQEFCTGTPFLSEAVEFPVDPLANTFTAVAAGFSIDVFRGGVGLDLGGFYNGLTRDDVGGLRYLLRTNNMNIESAGTDTFTFITNNNAPQLLFTSNLTEFVDQALTNNAAALNALYPDLIILGTTPIFTNVVTAELISYFTNFPYDPFGTPAHLVTATVLVTNVVTWFNHTFANVRVITNGSPSLLTTLADVRSLTNGSIFILTTNISTAACSPFAPFGSICTNISFTPVFSNMIQGAYFIVPSNLCDVSIVSTQFIQTVFVTNLIAAATNAPATTNVGVQEFSESLVYSFDQHIFVVRPVVCPTNSIALRQGIDRIKFTRRDFDSLLNRFFYPITNTYLLNAITNNTLIPQRVERVVTQPDFLITADDFATTPGDAIIGAGAVTRGIQFSTNSAYPGLFGPGTIEPGTGFSFNKVGPIYLNGPFFFLGAVPDYSEATHVQLLAWGSFDGSTNAPVVYPNGTSITNLENAVLIQISPSAPITNGAVQLPNATVGVDYTNVFSGFSAAGGQPPYTWSLAPGSPGLPPGMVEPPMPDRILPNGMISGAPAPGTAGLTFDFVIRMTDAGSRFVDRAFAITINP